MYHPINLPDCPQLERFNEFIRLLMAFSLEQTNTQPEAEIKPLFEQYFADASFAEAGSWFWGKPMAIRRPLLKLLALPVAEKQGILAAFTADIDLEGRFADGHLKTSNLPSDCTAALALAGEIVQNCYTRILAKDGVPAGVLQMDAPLDRQTVLRAYLEAQNRRQVNDRPSPLKACPGCDGRPPSVSDGKIHEDLDHFFPKSRYPLLAVHLLNLTPFCKDCNQTFKGSKDAILDESEPVADVLCLHDIFHPYLRPALPEVEVSIARNEEGEPHVFIRPRYNDQRQLARLHSLLYTLDVNGRWDGDLIEDRLRPKLEKQLYIYGWQVERTQGEWKLDQAKLREGLSIIIAANRHYIGQEPGNVALLAYARWLNSDAQAQQEWLTVMEEVCLVEQ